MNTSTSIRPLDLLVALLNEAYQTGARVADDGAVHLRMEDDLAVSVAASADERDLVFYAPLADLLRGRSVALMTAALGMNLHQELTRGGAIAVEPATQTLIYCWRMDAAEAEPERLAWGLENFCATAADLRLRLEEALADFTVEELADIDRRAAHDEALSEDASLASPAPSNATHIVRG